MFNLVLHSVSLETILLIILIQYFDVMKLLMIEQKQIFVHSLLKIIHGSSIYSGKNERKIA